MKYITHPFENNQNIMPTSDIALIHRFKNNLIECQHPSHSKSHQLYGRVIASSHEHEVNNTFDKYRQRRCPLWCVCVRVCAMFVVGVSRILFYQYYRRRAIVNLITFPVDSVGDASWWTRTGCIGILWMESDRIFSQLGCAVLGYSAQNKPNLPSSLITIVLDRFDL